MVHFVSETGEAVKFVRICVCMLPLLACADQSQAQLEGARPDTQPASHPVAAIQDAESPAQRDARLAWWREARFGMLAINDDVVCGLY
jgi:hypothetical protein